VLTFFNAFFGKRAFSWKCFGRVAAITLTACSLLWTFVLISALKHPRPHPEWVHVEYDIPRFAMYLLIVTVTFNVPLDYVTVLKTRLLLRLAAKHSQSFFVSALTIAIDIVSTAFVILPLVALIAVYVLVGGIGNPGGAERNTLPLGVLWILIFGVIGMVTFIHSIWLAVYFVATLLAKCATWFVARLPPLGKILSQERIEKSPITLIGEFAAVIVVLMFLVIGLVMPGAHNAENTKGETTATHTQ
jgi:hypothetical protein